MNDIDRMDAVAQSLDRLRDSLEPKIEAAQQEIQRKGRSYFRGAVVASVIISVLVSIALALIVNQLRGHADADKEHFDQLDKKWEKMSEDIQGLKQDAQGLRGEPPMSWIVTEADGSLTTCERAEGFDAEGFDPASPRYRCSPGAR